VSVTRRNRSVGNDVGPFLAVGAMGVLIALVLGAWAAMLAGAAIAHHPKPASNPVLALINLATGKTHWPGPAATAIAAAELLLVLGIGVLVWRSTRTARRPRVGVDAAVAHLADRREQAVVSLAEAKSVAARLGAPTDHPGVRVGRARGTGQGVYGTWELVQCDIWGPRTGKTTSRAIPALIDAPGAALATSNKRDLVDATRGIREDVGTVWVFDPQKVAGEEPTWWWDPLSYVVDIDKATRLAAVWCNYSRPADAKQDAYFDPKGEQLLACLLLAAATAKLPLTTVFEWATDPTDATAVDILKKAGHKLPAAAVQGVINAPDKQRAGVYGTAEKVINFLINPAIAKWVTQQGPSDKRPRFDPHKFVRSRGTLYLLSREGQGTSGPLVTALTVATIEAAEELATRSPGGRLRVPMLCVLDEAANVCRWKDLPDLYSHYGSRGIILMTILQNWAQGVMVWGQEGMTKLWSASNIRVYGGGEIDPRFLGNLSQLIGDYEAITVSVSTQRGAMASRSTSTATRVEKVLEISDLAALPKGRALVFASGTRPVLIETEPWQNGPHAEKVRASLAKYVPAGDTEEWAKHELEELPPEVEDW
jgi:type IV secretory pathway TraG/TraD family ATPase VirD4/predicted small integral membrane protein